MSFIARVTVTTCGNCPHKEPEDSLDIIMYTCPEIKSNPMIVANQILKNCPYNIEDKEIMPISEYVRSRQR